MDYEQAIRRFVQAHAVKGSGSRSARESVMIACAGADELGLALMRLRLLDDRYQFVVALRALQPIVRRDLKRKRVQASGESSRRATAKALRAWLGGVCQACSGRSYESIPGTPTLSATRCKQCGGTGLDMSGRIAGEYREQCDVALAIIDARYWHAVGTIRSRLIRESTPAG